VRSVAWFLTDLTGGGAERLPLVLAPALGRSRLRLVLLKDTRVHRVPEGLEVTALSRPEIPLRASMTRVFAGAARAAGAARVVVGGMEWAATHVAAGAAAWTRRPLVAVVHTDLERFAALERVPRAAWPLQRWSLASARRVVALSDGAAASARRLGTREERLRVIPNPVSPWAFEAAVARATTRVPGPLRLLAAGRLHPVKGFDVLLEALARLPGATLALVGEGPARAALEGLARERGVAARVRFAGFVDDPGEHFAAADAFVLSSRLEGMPLVLAEAMAAGLPVVATRCSAAVERALGDGAAGVLVPAGDAAALAAALAGLAADPAARSRLGAAGRARAAAWAPAVVAEAWEAVFDEALHA
jgi:glycosyltransferase involved in cell wall biosynthesis